MATILAVDGWMGFAKTVFRNPNLMQVTVDLPGDLAPQLERAGNENLAKIWALGLQEWKSRGTSNFSGLNAVLEQLARLPAPADVLALRPTPELQARAEQLLERARLGNLSADEQVEWNQIEFTEHLVRIAKANAASRLKQA